MSYNNNYNNQGGEAASYYNSAGNQQQPYGQQQQYGQQQGYGQQQQQQYGQNQQYGQQQDGPTGERGVLGAIGGAVAGGIGGNKIGGKVTGHSKTSTIIGAIAGAVAGHKIQDGVEDWKDKRDEEKEEKKKAEEEAKRREEDEKRRREDDDKRRKEEEDRRKNQHNQEQQQHHNRDSGVRYAGGFSGSCKDISLDQAGGEYVLRASCRGRDGQYRSSSIALNKIISNDRGSFRWAAPSSGNSCGGGKPAQYTVVAGDTLRAIGGRLGVSWEELARHNCIQNPDLIYPGQVLNIPGGGASHSSGVGGGNFGASARNVRLEDCGKKLVAELKRDGQWVGATLILDERIGNDNGALVYKQ